MWEWIIARFNKWVALGAVGIALFLCVFWWSVFSWMRPSAPSGPGQPAEIAVIAAPTITPSPQVDPTSTPDTDKEERDGISVGMVVQIGGTGGAGLRLRSEPGTASQVRFIGMDAEVFEVSRGPEDRDDIVWWYLSSPYDDARSGWAAAEYLNVVEKQP